MVNYMSPAQPPVMITTAPAVAPVITPAIAPAVEPVPRYRPSPDHCPGQQVRTIRKVRKVIEDA